MAEQEPSWDGTGVDPWLPDWMAAEARIVTAEQRLMQSWWASFSAWIVAVRRGVMTGYIPDPHAVWSYAPDWAKRMDDFTFGPVKATMGQAYTRIFGDGYEFDSRPAVAKHLAEVRNRMARTTDTVFDAVAVNVAKGAGAGESIPQIRDRIEQTLSESGSETWHNRAVTIARTETLNALNAGRDDTFHAVAEELDEPDLMKMWLATMDTRVRPDHKDVDGDRVPLDGFFLVGGEPLSRPGDPGASGRQVINCRCSHLLVHPDEDVDMTDRGWTETDDYWADLVQGD